MQHIPCSNRQICSTTGVVEDSVQAFNQLGDNPILIVQCIGIICSIACFNAFGVATTKNASAA